MANAFVQKVVKTSGGGVTTLTTDAPASSTTAGNLLVVCFSSNWSGSSGVPTDTGSNTYTLADSYANGSGDAFHYIYYCFNAASVSSSGGSWTCTQGTARDCGILVLEYSGLGVGSIGTTGDNGLFNSAGSSISAATGSASAAGSLIVASVGAWGNTPGAVSASGFTMRENASTNSANNFTAGGDILSASAAVQTAAFTWTNSLNYPAAVIVEFVPAGGGGGTAVKDMIGSGYIPHAR